MCLNPMILFPMNDVPHMHTVELLQSHICLSEYSFCIKLYKAPECMDCEKTAKSLLLTVLTSGVLEIFHEFNIDITTKLKI